MAKKRPIAKNAARKAVKAVRRKIAKPVTRKPAARRAAAKRVAAKPVAKRSAAESAGLRSIAAGFTVDDVQKSIAWYSDMLGFVVTERWEHDGTLRGAEMSSRGATIYLSQDDWAQGRDRVKGQGTRLYITTGEVVDTIADRIKAYGGTLDQEPKDDWGMRTFAVSDPDGYKLTFMYTPKK